MRKNRAKTSLLTLLPAVMIALCLSPAAGVTARQGGDDPHAALCDSGFVRLDRDDIEVARGLF